MAIDDIKREALNVLWNFHQVTGENNFTITGDILEEHGLNTDTFWTLICPRLVKNGILVQLPKPDYGDMIPIAEEKWLKMNQKFIKYSFVVNNDKLFTVINQKNLSHNREKIDVNIDQRKGIYLSDGELSYPISGRRFNIVSKLTEEEIIFGNELEDLTGWNMSDISHNIRDINKTFKKNLKVSEDLIIHNATGGYSFNHDKLNINSYL